MQNDEAMHIIDWIHGARQVGKKQGLNNMRALLGRLGNPHRCFRSIHVAGTNGKGSTCAYLERALRACGYKTGLYTSPYLCRYHERMQVNGMPIEDKALIRIGRRIQTIFDQLVQEGIYPTTFEINTALAFCLFAEQAVDIAVVEVGLGGRLDSTNVIEPMVCTIASIGLDHTKILGETLSEIAYEKAGIIKTGVPVALYPQTPEVDALFERICKERNAPLRRVEALPVQVKRQTAHGTQFDTALPALGELDVRINLPGNYQIGNAMLALAALSLLNEQGVTLPPLDIIKGMEATEWPGRLEWLEENLLIDGAHNLQGAHSLRDYMEQYLRGRRAVLLTGMMKDKQYTECAQVLAPAFDKVVTTKVDWPKAVSASDLRQVYENLGTEAIAVDGIEPALNAARALAGEDLLVVAGSLYLVGDVRSIVKK